jgi:acyl carrier protein
METLARIRSILRDSLNIGARAEGLTPESGLLGSVPEFDSMAVVSVVTMIEEEFGITIEDDELSADTFATVGALTSFVAGKLNGAR